MTDNFSGILCTTVRKIHIPLANNDCEIGRIGDEFGRIGADLHLLKQRFGYLREVVGTMKFTLPRKVLIAFDYQLQSFASELFGLDQWIVEEVHQSFGFEGSDQRMTYLTYFRLTKSLVRLGCLAYPFLSNLLELSIRDCLALRC